MAEIARGDTFELDNGGRVDGKMLDEGKTDVSVVVETPDGARLTIHRSQIAHVESMSDEEVQYEALARTSPDTVDAHWKLAQWCRDHDMRSESDEHLERVLQLDPDHAEARRLLGYRQENGQWMSRDEVMASRGMVRYEGRYVTRQHVELLERAKESRESDVQWSSRIDRLRRSLVGRRSDRAEQARQEILAIRDPEAAEAIVKMLRREKDPQVRRLWIQVAAQIDHPATLEALVHLSLFDPDDETRRQCLDDVVRSGYPGIAGPYMQALRNSDNEIINRAAAALARIGDPSAIGPLIDALETKHTFKVSSGTGGQYALNFSPSGGSGYTFGGGGPKTTTRWVRNPAVLGALTSLAGISFEYDQDAWRAWLAAQAKLNQVDVRRDR